MDNLENIDVSNMDVSTMSKVIERLWPKFLDAGMNIVWAVLILIVGLKLISILRKFLKKTLLRPAPKEGSPPPASDDSSPSIGPYRK